MEEGRDNTMNNYEDKNIYDMLNDIEIDLSEFDREDFNDIEKMRVKKKFRKSIGKKNDNKNYKRFIGVASVGIIGLGTILFTPVGTYASKVITDLVFDIKSALRLDQDAGNYTQTINKSITKEGITLRLNEAVLNSDELIISLTTISEEKLKNETRIDRESSKLYINGKFVKKSQMSSLGTVSKSNIDEVMFFGVDANKYKGVIDVKLELGDVSIYKDEKNKERDIKGPFIFEFKLDTSKVNSSTKEINLNQKIELDNGGIITLEKYVATPLSQKIYYNKVQYNEDEMFVLKGTDNIGNEIEFDLYSEEDEKGELIANRDGKKIDEDIKTLTLTPYKKIWNGKSIEFEKIGKEIKININK